MTVGEELKVMDLTLLRHHERSVAIQCFCHSGFVPESLILDCFVSLAMTETWHKNLFYHPRCISLIIPRRHTLYGICAKYMNDILSIFFFCVEIDIFRDHFSFPVSDKIVIDNDSLIIYLSHENIEHRESIEIICAIFFIISFTRRDKNDFFWMFFREEGLHDRRMSDMRWIKGSAEDINHVSIVSGVSFLPRKNLHYGDFLSS